MIPGFSKQTITIGSAPNADIRLAGPGVAPEHARLAHEGGGKLVFVDTGAGPCTAGGRPLPPRSSHPFDFRTEFTVGGVAVPLAHRAITLMLLERGQAPVTPGELVVGRDPARANLVVHHPNVSGRHATLTADPASLTDLGSTSGSWLGQVRLEPNRRTPFDGGTIIALGPIPFEPALALELVRGLAGAAAPPPGATGLAAMPKPIDAPPGADGVSRPKHRTIVGQVTLGIPGQADAKTIGRTPENDIKVDHPQVSSKHAFLHKVGGELFVEDRGSAN